MTKPYLATSRWKKQRLLVLRRDAYTCAYCGDVANEVDHVHPRSKGGTDDINNLVACCRTCNIRKKDRVFLNGESTPPVFSERSLPETVRTVPDSPFIKPDTLDFDAK